MTEPDADSGSAHMSGDGRYVAFLSEASNLVDGDTNGARDVFVWDRVTLAQERVSTAFDGAEANGPSGAPRISTDGRYVAFTSGASNLVPDDNNGRWDLFLRDRIAGTTVRLVDSDMLVPSPDTDSVSFTHRFAFYSMSADARLFALGFRPETASVRILNRITGMIEQITAPGGGAPDDSGQSFVIFPWLSLDGSKLAFDSLATNLVADDTNEIRDVFILDRQSGSFDRLGDQTIPSTVPGSGFVASTLSADNRYIALATGPMYNSDYVYPERAVVFDRIDRVVSHTIASDPTRSLFAVDSAQISPDARFVAVASRNENFVPDSYYDAGFFIVNLTTGVRADLINSGGFGGFTDDGRFIALSSATNGLVLHDTNDLWDVFVAQHLTPVTAMAGPRCPGMP